MDKDPKDPTAPQTQRIVLIIIVAIALLGIIGFALYSWLAKKPTTAPHPASYKVEVVAQNLTVPWAIIFTDSSRMVVTERSGAVRVVENGQLQQAPLLTFDEVSSKTGGVAEKGLMGLAKDPHYTENKYLYTCLTYENTGKSINKVVRFSDQTGGGQRVTILDNIPAADNHVGCRVKFGPDQKLYISVGDSQNKPIAQEVTALAGKILRINSDGSIPSDNPFKDSPVWSYGHRNPQGFDWQPGTDHMIATEHGPTAQSGDGKAGGDEINLIEKGGNYGWPIVSHDDKQEGMISPLITFTPAVAPSAGLFYRSSVLPQFKNNYFFGMLVGEGIERIVFDEKDPRHVISYEKLTSVDVGRVREVVEGPDGAIYFATSNRDGRAEVFGTKIRDGDDKIYRLTPQR